MAEGKFCLPRKNSQHVSNSSKVEEGLGGARPVLRGDAEELTSQFAGLQALLTPTNLQPYNRVSIQDNTYEGTEYRIYTPHRETNAQDRFPIGVFFHGGGFVLGDLETEDALCRAIAQNANTLIISVNYRKAPAHKLPAQLQDALKMFQWVCYFDLVPLMAEMETLTTSTPKRHAAMQRLWAVNQTNSIPSVLRLVAPLPLQWLAKSHLALRNYPRTP